MADAPHSARSLAETTARISRHFAAFSAFKPPPEIRAVRDLSKTLASLSEAVRHFENANGPMRETLERIAANTAPRPSRPTRFPRLDAPAVPTFEANRLLENVLRERQELIESVKSVVSAVDDVRDEIRELRSTAETSSKESSQLQRKGLSLNWLVLASGIVLGVLGVLAAL